MLNAGQESRPEIRFIYELSIYEFEETTVNHSCYFEWSSFEHMCHVYTCQKGEYHRSKRRFVIETLVREKFVQGEKQERETQGRMEEEKKRRRK